MKYVAPGVMTHMQKEKRWCCHPDSLKLQALYLLEHLNPLTVFGLCSMVDDQLGTCMGSSIMSACGHAAVAACSLPMSVVNAPGDEQFPGPCHDEPLQPVGLILPQSRIASTSFLPPPSPWPPTKSPRSLAAGKSSSSFSAFPPKPFAPRHAPSVLTDSSQVSTESLERSFPIATQAQRSETASGSLLPGKSVLTPAPSPPGSPSPPIGQHIVPKANDDAEESAPRPVPAKQQFVFPPRRAMHPKDVIVQVLSFGRLFRRVSNFEYHADVLVDTLDLLRNRWGKNDPRTEYH